MLTHQYTAVMRQPAMPQSRAKHARVFHRGFPGRVSHYLRVPLMSTKTLKAARLSILDSASRISRAHDPRRAANTRNIHSHNIWQTNETIRRVAIRAKTWRYLHVKMATLEHTPNNNFSSLFTLDRTTVNNAIELFNYGLPKRLSNLTIAINPNIDIDHTMPDTSAIAVKCPLCHALPNEPCRSRSVSIEPYQYCHSDRWQVYGKLPGTRNHR